MPGILRTWEMLATTVFVAAACTSEPAEPFRTYDVPLRSEIELTTELIELCETSMAGSRNASSSGTGHPILVEFSAAWCSDCQRLSQMKRATALAKELSEWPHTTVNVGRFDRHREILDAMKIQSIAHWAILGPENCDDPIDRWARIADRTLEVSSGAARNFTPADLANWLRGFRRS